MPDKCQHHHVDVTNVHLNLHGDHVPTDDAIRFRLSPIMEIYVTCRDCGRFEGAHLAGAPRWAKQAVADRCSWDLYLKIVLDLAKIDNGQATDHHGWVHQQGAVVYVWPQPASDIPHCTPPAGHDDHPITQQLLLTQEA